MDQDIEKNRPCRAKPLLNICGSLPAALGVLLLIALASALGTALPQGEEALAAVRKLSQPWLFLWNLLDLGNIFHSFWFRILLLLLALNLICCSTLRLPPRWRQVRQLAALPTPDGDPLRQVWRHEPPTVAVAILRHTLRTIPGRLREIPGQGIHWLTLRRGLFSPLGVYGIHLGLVLILAGILWGTFFAVEASLTLPEGQAQDTLIHRRQKPPERLPFTVRCDRFVLDHYEGGMPRTYRSDLSFLQSGQVVRQGSVLVNHPFAFGGYRFYQTAYGTMPRGDARIAVTHGRTGPPVQRTVARGESFSPPGSPERIMVERLEGNLMGLGPAIRLRPEAPGQNRPFWIFEKAEQVEKQLPGLLAATPLFDPEALPPYRFTLLSLPLVPYTRLTVRRDPGLPFAAAGAAFILLGILVTFIRPARTIWVGLDGRDGGTRIRVYGRHHRDPEGFERDLQGVCNGLQGGAS